MAHDEPSFPGAVAPERHRTLQRGAIELALHEWGDPEGEPVLLAHGMFDHSRGFDVVAPILAERFRVVAVDARGHGDSGWAHAYNWPDDIFDLCAVVESLGGPVHLVGHSKGGGQVTDAAAFVPEHVRSIVNMDGFGPPKNPPQRPDLPATQAGRFAMWLDFRRQSAERAWRPAAALEDLVARRQKANQRLTPEWLRYFCHHAAAPTEGGWRWKSDPMLGTGFGPFKPDWIAPAWANVKAPLLAMVGTVPDFYGPCEPDLLAERVANIENVEQVVVDGAGHFLHMERPEETAGRILDFLVAA